MATVYVLDASALHAIPAACGGAGKVDPFLIALGEMVSRREACFCRNTLDSLRVLAGAATPVAWAVQAAQGMWIDISDWYAVQNVTVAIENDMDADLLDDEPEVCWVIAMALDIGADTAVVVTEDDIDKPDLPSMFQACNKLGVKAITLDQFATDTGLDQHL